MKEIIEQLNIWAIIDILVTSFFLYHALLLIKGTRAAQMLIGILFLVGTFVLSTMAPFTMLNWIMSRFYSSFIIIIIILFQDDIRHALSSIGKKSLINYNDRVYNIRIIDEITRAATVLAGKRIGALIVLEKHIILNRYIDVGIPIDGRISKELLHAIFHHSSPIHDGAVIIRKGKIASAGCFLPLAREENIDQNLGTRHRAAIGISQQTDALVIVVSEEGGSIGVVMEGEFRPRLSPKEIRAFLIQNLMEEPFNSHKKSEKNDGAEPLAASHISDRNAT